MPSPVDITIKDEGDFVLATGETQRGEEFVDSYVLVAEVFDVGRVALATGDVPAFVAAAKALDLTTESE